MKSNHYAKLRQHKRELKLNHAKRTHRFSIRKDKERQQSWLNYRWWAIKSESKRNNGYNYWHRAYLTKYRKEAKRRTNRHIRRGYRNALETKDFEEIISMNGSDYEKEFDYLYYIY